MVILFGSVKKYNVEKYNEISRYLATNDIEKIKAVLTVYNEEKNIEFNYAVREMLCRTSQKTMELIINNLSDQSLLCDLSINLASEKKIDALRFTLSKINEIDSIKIRYLFNTVYILTDDIESMFVIAKMNKDTLKRNKMFHNIFIKLINTKNFVHSDFIIDFMYTMAKEKIELFHVFNKEDVEMIIQIIEATYDYRINIIKNHISCNFLCQIESICQI